MKKLKLNHKGQGLMEYIILSTLIGIVCLLATKQLGSVIHKRIQYIRERIVDQIPIK